MLLIALRTGFPPDRCRRRAGSIRSRRSTLSCSYVLSLRARQRSEASWNHSPPASRAELRLWKRKHLPKCRRCP